MEKYVAEIHKLAEKYSDLFEKAGILFTAECQGVKRPCLMAYCHGDYIISFLILGARLEIRNDRHGYLKATLMSRDGKGREKKISRQEISPEEVYEIIRSVRPAKLA